MLWISWLLLAAATPSADSMSAQIDGKPFAAEWTNASQLQMGGKDVFNFNGHIGTGPDSRYFNCQLAGPAKGSFKIGEGAFPAKSSCSYITGPDLQADRYRFQDGTIELTSVDTGAHVVSGRFQGSAKNGTGKSLKVTEGSFSIHYTQTASQ